MYKPYIRSKRTAERYIIALQHTAETEPDNVQQVDETEDELFLSMIYQIGQTEQVAITWRKHEMLLIGISKRFRDFRENKLDYFIYPYSQWGSWQPYYCIK